MTRVHCERLDGLRVLLVEDETVVAMLLEDMLADLGCVVRTASRLAKALELLQRIEVDVALLDLNVAGEEVYPVAEALVARNVPLVFATGYGAGGLARAWRERPTLQKPFQQRQLLLALREALDPGRVRRPAP